LERDWVDTKTNREKSSKETLSGCKAARRHYVGGGVVPWVSSWFSVFCVQKDCMWEKFQMLHTVAYLFGE